MFRESVRRDPFNLRFCEYRLLLTVEGSVFYYTLACLNVQKHNSGQLAAKSMKGRGYVNPRAVGAAE